MKPLVISFSGGRTSAYMTKYLLDKWSGKREIIVLFYNTGKEREETLQFVHKCDLYFNFNTVWLEATFEGLFFKVVDFETASRKGEPFEKGIKIYGLPNVSFPWCSRELKTRLFNKYISHLGYSDFDNAIGIRSDEPKRLKKHDRVIYPLATENRQTKKSIIQWWKLQTFDLELLEYEGNCDMCWKKSKRKLLTLLVEKPELADWWNEMEIKYGEFVPPTQKEGRKIPITIYRHNESIADLLEDSKQPFKKSTDAFSLQDLMFSQPELDFTNGCEESCEPF